MHTMPIATVDAVLLTIQNGRLMAAVQKRDKEPFKNELALPGGYFHVETDKDAEDAISRVIETKIGLDNVFVEQLVTVSGKDRDPRGWSLSVVFLGLFPDGALDTQNLTLVDALTPPPMAFDHNTILKMAMQRLKGKGAYSTLPATLLKTPFTLSQLQGVYETVLDTTLETSAFRRKILALDLLEVTQATTSGRGRPGKLYTLKDGARTFDKRSLLPQV